MKKILFFSAAAALMLASCANEETVQAPKGNAIDFGNAFVNNSTKAGDVTTENIRDFAVYGYMATMAGDIFNKQEVSSTDGKTWTYSPVQYWTPGQNYWFVAIAPFAEEVEFIKPSGTLPTGAAGTINYSNTKGDTDLCTSYLTYTASKENNEVQKFTFGHILSRVKFTFKNEMANANAKFEISNVKITATNTAGEFNCTNKTWTAATATNDVAFNIAGTKIAQSGNLASDPMYLIPGASTVVYNVEFTVIRYQGTETTPIDTYNHKVQIKGVELALGNSYNFTATINDSNIDPNPENKPEPIVFGVQEVEDWGQDNAQVLPVPTPDN